MPRPYRQLTLEERRALFRLLNAKLPVAEIARQLGRHRSTIFREISRNLFRDVKEYRGYYPITANDSAKRRRQRRRKLIRDAQLQQHVTEMLARWWSPEQIAGRLKQASDDARVSHETIYQFVYSPEGRALALHHHLLRARRLCRRRFGRKPRSPKIPLARTIGQRPAEIDRRQEIGHWEADLLIFRRAHARRKLYELAVTSKAPVAAEAVRRIDRLFAVERDIAGLSAEARLAARRERSAPILADLEPWLRQQQERLSRKSEVGKAIAYTLRRWEALTRFMTDGRICLSNNAAERALRGVAVGRRNWTFAGSGRGGERAAAIYTLIETAKLNGVDPQAWLGDVLARLPDHPAKRIAELLPWNWRAEQLATAVEP